MISDENISGKQKDTEKTEKMQTENEFLNPSCAFVCAGRSAQGESLFRADSSIGSTFRAMHTAAAEINRRHW